MKTLETRLDECERRILVLEKFREKDSESNIKTKSDLSSVSSKIEDLIKSVDVLPQNLEKLMEKNFLIQQKEHDKIYTQLAELKTDSVESKQKIKELEEKLEEQTFIKNSKNWDNFKWLFVAGAIGIVFMILELIIKGGM